MPADVEEPLAQAEPSVDESSQEPAADASHEAQPPPAESAEVAQEPENAPPDPPPDAPAAVPTAPLPPPEKIWQDLSRQGYILELPEVVGRQEGFDRVPGSRDLVKVDGAAPVNCELELLGLAAAFPKNRTPKLVKTTADRDETIVATWELRAIEDNFGLAEQNTIALFELNDGMLSFQWTPWSVRHVDIDKMKLLHRVQNCLLRIRVGNERSLPCGLRKPFELPPAGFDFERKNEHSWTLTEVQQLSESNRRRLHLKVDPLQQGVPVHEVTQSGENRVSILFPPQPEFASSWRGLVVEIEVIGRNEGAEIEFVARTMPLGKKESEPKESKEPSLPVRRIAQVDTEYKDANAACNRLDEEIRDLVEKARPRREIDEKTIEREEWQREKLYWEWVLRTMEQLQGGRADLFPGPVRCRTESQLPRIHTSGRPGRR